MKPVDESREVNSIEGGFAAKARLNLNDLLQRRKEEKKIEKKTNLLIFSGAAVTAVVVIAILSL